MAQLAAGAVSSTLTLRNYSFLKDIWQGGSMAFFDKEVSGTKVGYLQLVGNVTPASGASLQTKVKSAEFIEAMATGVGTVSGKPISQIEPTIQLKVNAPSLLTLAKLLMSTDPTTVTQNAISVDTQKVIDGSTTPFVLGVWYTLGAMSITKFGAAIDAGGGTFTQLAASDYELDTELGAVKFKAGGANALDGTQKISCLYQAGALTNQPLIAPGANPKYSYGGVYIYTVLAANEARSGNEVWLHYMPRARFEPSGNFDVTVDKPGEVTLDCVAVPSPEISGQPFGFLKQIAGAMRGIA
jgi:hypothetical protein